MPAPAVPGDPEPASLPLDRGLGIRSTITADQRSGRRPRSLPRQKRSRELHPFLRSVWPDTDPPRDAVRRPRRRRPNPPYEPERQRHVSPRRRRSRAARRAGVDALASGHAAHGRTSGRDHGGRGDSARLRCESPKLLVDSPKVLVRDDQRFAVFESETDRAPRHRRSMARRRSALLRRTASCHAGWGSNPSVCGRTDCRATRLETRQAPAVRLLLRHRQPEASNSASRPPVRPATTILQWMGVCPPRRSLLECRIACWL
jgi:hypothetical protein